MRRMDPSFIENNQCKHGGPGTGRRASATICKDEKTIWGNNGLGKIRPSTDTPVDRAMLIVWVKTFHADSAEELREALLWRLKEGLFHKPEIGETVCGFNPQSDCPCFEKGGAKV